MGGLTIQFWWRGNSWSSISKVILKKQMSYRKQHSIFISFWKSLAKELLEKLLLEFISLLANRLRLKPLRKSICKMYSVNGRFFRKFICSRKLNIRMLLGCLKFLKVLITFLWLWNMLALVTYYNFWRGRENFPRKMRSLFLDKFLMDLLIFIAGQLFIETLS